MRRFAILTLAGALVLSAAFGAQAADKPGTKNNGLSICEEQYLAVWNQVLEEKVGPYDGAAGRNVVQDGVETKNGVRPSTEAECKSGLAVMDRMLNPAPAPAPAPEATTSSTTTYAPAPTSSGGCPASMAGEASSPDAYNPASGASGCYQVIPSTADAMGPACDDVNSGDCLAAICAAQGNDAWVAADPC